MSPDVKHALEGPTMMPVVAVFLLLLGCLALVTSRYRYRTRPLGRREIHDACDALMLRAACVEHERMDARLRALLDARMDACVDQHDTDGSHFATHEEAALDMHGVYASWWLFPS